MNLFNKREMLYLNKDIPIFYHFIFPELAAFKSYFWMRSILNYPEYANKQFKISEHITDEIRQTGHKLAEAYSQLPSQEIWNIESLEKTMDYIPESTRTLNVPYKMYVNEFILAIIPYWHC
ncbi:hypothetical protein [Pinibacter soli]|uniref:Uncharacterized protein n=1 Tax=Pinibacter soli TaxID=3044211 RepID=A0ABT6RES4_9BACT|nr:hypothetical protein [Pinibacter soli]MDI3320916.1 hypothetical protein [Pinibacter soli]